MNTRERLKQVKKEIWYDDLLGKGWVGICIKNFYNNEVVKEVIWKNETRLYSVFVVQFMNDNSFGLCNADFIHLHLSQRSFDKAIRKYINPNLPGDIDVCCELRRKNCKKLEVRNVKVSQI